VADKPLLEQVKGRETYCLSSDGKCTLWLPGAIILGGYPLWPQEGIARSYEIGGGDMYCRFAMIEQTSLEKGTDKEKLTKAVEGRLKDSDVTTGTIVSRGTTTRGKFEGEEVVFNSKKGDETTFLRFCIANGIIYRLEERGPTRQELSSAGKKFFESLAPVQ
jgi:hypothetical protein